jgi:hypothetical protein
MEKKLRKCEKEIVIRISLDEINGEYVFNIYHSKNEIIENV